MILDLIPSTPDAFFKQEAREKTVRKEITK
jgi:hypothetical protein